MEQKPDSYHLPVTGRNILRFAFPTIVMTAVMMALGYTFMDTLLGTMGLSPAVFGCCHTCLSNYLLFTIPILLMYNFSLYLIAADRSKLSLICTVAGGVTNIILDYAWRPASLLCCLIWQC